MYGLPNEWPIIMAAAGLQSVDEPLKRAIISVTYLITITNTQARIRGDLMAQNHFTAAEQAAILQAFGGGKAGFKKARMSVARLMHKGAKMPSL